MLYVFIVSSGTMMKFDMNLAVKKVIELKNEIARRAKIPQEEQVLLCSGGEELQSDSIVGNYYGAGTDTNPIFLFSKFANEVEHSYSSHFKASIDMSIANDVKGCESMAPSIGSATVKLSLAQRFAESAINGRQECEELVHSQHLQQQGWAAVIANLEDAKDTLFKRKVRFEELFQKYLANRTSYLETIYMFPKDIELLAKIPLLPKLIIENDCSEDDLNTKHTLLSWFISEPQDVLETLVEKCHRLLDELNEYTIAAIDEDLQKVLKNVDNSYMKEVKGIEGRLSGLNSQIETARQVEKEQQDLAVWFNNFQGEITSDPHVLPDLCDTLQRQLKLMLERHNTLIKILDRCKTAKIELSESINFRLKYISKVESEMYQLHMRIILLESHVQSVMSQVESYHQVQLAPQRYLKLLVEVCRRKVFSSSFLKWATELSSHASKLYHKEISLRKTFASLETKNMVDNLFPGMNDVPPPFAVECPPPFDRNLPDIVKEDLEWLKMHCPELSNFCEVITPDPMPYISQVESDSAFSSNVPSSRVASDSVVLSEKISSKEDIPTNKLAVPSAEYSSLPSEYASLPNEVFSLTSSPFEDPLLSSHMQELHTKTMQLSSKNPSGEQGGVYSDGEEFETVDHYRMSPVATNSQSAHGTRTRPTSSSDVIDVNTHQKRSRISKARSDGDAVSPMQDRLKSPDSLAISTDFQAAEYYIDDSMPSSYTESNATSPLMRGSKMVKSHHIVVAELQRQVEEKSGALNLTKSSLENSHTNILKLHAKLSALQNFVQELQGSLKSDLSNFKTYVTEELCCRLAEVRDVVEYINSYVGKVTQHMLLEKETAVSDARTEFASIENSYLKKLEVETQKLSDAENQIAYYEDHLRAVCLSYEETKHEKELLELELQEKRELIQRMMLEQELELDAFKNQTKETLCEQELEITQLKQKLSEALSNVSKYQNENTSLLEESQKLQSVTTVLQDQQKHLEGEINRLQEENQSVKSFQETKQKLQVALEDNMQYTKELKRAKEDFEIYKEDMEKLKTNELRKLEEELNTKHRSDIESLRSRFRLAVSMTAADKSPTSTTTDCDKCDSESLDCVEELKTIMAEHREKWESDKLKAIEEERLKILNSHKESIEDVQIKHEEEKNQIIEALRLQHENALEKLKSRITAENQISFNEAINSLAKEKDLIIESLRSQLSVLEAKQFAIKSYLDHCYAASFSSEAESAMSQSESAAIGACVKVQSTDEHNFFQKFKTDLEALLQVTDTTKSSYHPSRTCSDTCEGLKKKLKLKEEEYSCLLSKFMSVSRPSCIHCANKVSILTCEPGEVVLVCYEEKLEHYTIFHFGNHIHFLHSESAAALDLKIPAGTSQRWAIGVVINKEFCVTKKVNNRFKLNLGTRFYRVKVDKWSRTAAASLQRSVQNTVTEQPVYSQSISEASNLEPLPTSDEEEIKSASGMSSSVM